MKGFKTHVKREQQVLKRIRRKRKRKAWMVILGLMCGGCGHTVREAGLAALRVTGAALEDTGRICSNGAKAMGKVGQVDALPEGVQELDPQQLDEIARSLGYRKEVE